MPVKVFGRKESRRAELEAAGIQYFVLPVVEKQISFIQEHLTEETIVMTAARTPGRKCPVLIDEKSLSILPSSAVVVDLAISNGGNVVGSKYDQIIAVGNDVSIINTSGYPKKEPRPSSETYAECVASLLMEIMSPEGVRYP